MSIMGSVEALNARKAAVLDDPGRAREGAVLELDDWRPVLVGLDLDIIEVERVASGCAMYGLRCAATGTTDLVSSIRALAFDMFVAGVYYERSRGDASGGDHA